MKKSFDRRDFLKQTLLGACSLSPLASWAETVERPSVNVAEESYKAIVCILLEGGADTFNMLVPIRDGEYRKYRRVRQNLALPHSSLLPITERFGMRENMEAMQQLFKNGKLAVVANVGTLVEPVTPEEVRNGTKAVPFELFAHNTQRNQWMMGDASGSAKDGWAGRTARRFYAEGDPGAAYACINTADVNALLLSGGREDAIRFADASVSPDTMKRYGFGPESGGGALGRVYQRLYKHKMSDSNLLMEAFAKKRVAELNRPDRLEGLFDGVREFDNFSTGVHEVGKPLGAQLELVAQILSVKENFPGEPKRQIFFVNHHGWDTHDSDNEHQVGYLSECLGAFQEAVESLGLSENVTTLTLSDFGRSITPNGAGTDHGWGSHAFVMGGAVPGGKIYGRMPRIQTDSPDAWYDRLVPSVAMESYLSTVLKWFGASRHDRHAILPNLKSFKREDLGFMS